MFIRDTNDRLVISTSVDDDVDKNAITRTSDGKWWSYYDDSNMWEAD